VRQLTRRKETPPPAEHAFGRCDKLKTGIVGQRSDAATKTETMTSAREFLVREVEQLSEEDAREVLDLLKRRQAKGVGLRMPKLTREDMIERLAGRPGIQTIPAGSVCSSLLRDSGGICSTDRLLLESFLQKMHLMPI